MILQAGGAVPRSAVELVLTASLETKIVLVITAIFSLVSWFIIMLKWWQFRRLNKQADRFFAEMERTTRLQDAYHAVMKQPPSPYNRLFREAITFYSELRPGALREERGAERSSLTPTQLEALKMVLGKEVAAERDLLGHYMPWLATIGSVSPLLGLLGTTLGIINAFTGIATKGSGNLAAVAPGRGRGAGGHLRRPGGRDSGGDRVQPVRQSGPALRGRARGLRQRADRHDGARRADLGWRPDSAADSAASAARCRSAPTSTSPRWST